MVYYAPSRFAPRPRKAAPPGAARGARRTVGEAMDPDGIVCIRIRAYGWTGGARTRHTIRCYDAQFGEVLLSTDPAAEVAEREQLLAAMLAAFPDVDWTRNHQILLGGDGTAIWAAPDVDEPGFIPEDDRTFGALRPPAYAAAPWNENAPTLPLGRAA